MPRHNARLPIQLWTLVSLVALTLFSACGRPPSGSAPPTATTTTPQPEPAVFVGAEALYALGVRDGAVEWQYRVGSGSASQISSLVVGGGIAYFATNGTGTVYALDVRTRTLRWQRTVGSPLTLSLTLSGGSVYASSAQESKAYPPNGSVFALRAGDGTPLWRFQTDGNIFSAPTISGDTVYVGSSDGAAYALRADDGKLLWRYSTGHEIEAAPTVTGGLAYVAELSADGGDPSLYALRAADGMMVWRYQTGAPDAQITATPAVDGGTVYFGTLDGSAYAVGAADGKLRWRHQGIGSIDTPVAVSTGLVLVSTVGEDLLALDAADGSTRWHTNVAGFGGITVAGDVAYVGVRVRGFADSPATGSVFAISASDGTTLWTVGTGAPATTPVLATE